MMGGLRRLAAVDGWRLVVVGGWRLVAVGGWWQLAVSGWWSLGAVLNKKKSGPFRTIVLVIWRDVMVLALSE